MLIFRLFELVLVLAVLWVLANVVRATIMKASNGGDFWGLSNWMCDTEKRKAQEKVRFDAAVKAEAEKLIAEAAKKGGQG